MRTVISAVNKLCCTILVVMLRSYKLFISPLLAPSCRFQPTCSQYMVDAIKLYGPIRGIMLGTRRILRCHPWSKNAFDPVPAKTDKKTEI